MGFIRGLFFFLTAAAIVALGANELHHHYKRQLRSGVNKGIGREIHDNLSEDRVSGKPHREAVTTQEKTEATKYNDELSREDKSKLDELIEKVM